MQQPIVAHLQWWPETRLYQRGLAANGQGATPPALNASGRTATYSRVVVPVLREEEQ
jgi:hypothetical protein